jgi:peptidoglycan/LPS O-acetylase OafA/YrhL
MKNSHIPIINTLRGLAALSVCFYHFVCTTTGYINDELVLEVFHFASKGVQVFFIISGIVIPLSMIKSNYSFKSLPKFILKRFVRIEPPYLGVVLIGCVYLIVRNYVPSANNVDLTPSLRDVFLHIGYLVPFVEDAKWINPVFWTLSIEFQYYLFLALSFSLALSNVNWYRYVFYSILLLLPLILPFGQSFFPIWSAYFAFGIFYALYITNYIKGKEYLIISSLAGVIVYFTLGALDLVIAISTLVVINQFSNFKFKVGDFLGNISYSVYLLHSIVGSAFVNFMSHIFVEPHEKIIVILLGVFITVSFSYVYWRFIEKPTQKLAQKIK